MSGDAERGIHALSGPADGPWAAAVGAAGGLTWVSWPAMVAAAAGMEGGRCARMAALGSPGRRITAGPGPSATAAVGGGVITGAATAEEGPASEGRSTRPLLAGLGERDRRLGCLWRRGEAGERRAVVRGGRGESGRRGGDVDRRWDLDGRVRGVRATSAPLGAGEWARSRERVRDREGDEDPRARERGRGDLRGGEPRREGERLAGGLLGRRRGMERAEGRLPGPPTPGWQVWSLLQTSIARAPSQRRNLVSRSLPWISQRRNCSSGRDMLEGDGRRGEGE